MILQKAWQLWSLNNIVQFIRITHEPNYVQMFSNHPILQYYLDKYLKSVVTPLFIVSNAQLNENRFASVLHAALYSIISTFTNIHQCFRFLPDSSFTRPAFQNRIPWRHKLITFIYVTFSHIKTLLNARPSSYYQKLVFSTAELLTKQLHQGLTLRNMRENKED